MITSALDNNNLKHNITTAMSLCIPAIMIFGPYFCLGGCAIYSLDAAVTVNLTRLIIPLLFFALFYDDIGNIANMTKNKLYLSFFIVLLFWIAYGYLLLIHSSYSDINRGYDELVSIAIGALSVSIIVHLCINQQWNHLLNGIRIAILFMMIIGFFEVLTGSHLSFSRYSDPDYLATLGETVGSGKIHIATGFFNNENDYCAMIAIFAPFFLSSVSKISKAVGTFAICMIYALLLFDQAFICNIAFYLGIILALLFSHSSARNWIVTVLSLIITRFCVVIFTNTSSMGSLLFLELKSRQAGKGSMFHRLNTYIVSIEETFRTSKGFGFGPGSFTNYFQQFAETRQIEINPHCFWFEILSEYGVIVFSLFVGILVAIMVSLIKRTMNSQISCSAPVIGSGFSMIIASVAPSSFLGYIYYWIPIGLALYLVAFYHCPDEQND